MAGFITEAKLVEFLYWVSFALCFVASIWLLLLAFGESFLCGILYWFLPFYSLFYVITRWQRCRKPSVLLIISILGIVIFGLMQ